MPGRPSNYHHLRRRWEPPQSTVPGLEWAVCLSAEQCGHVPQPGHCVVGMWGKQGPGKGGLWFTGCSMKIKELCQRLLFLLASP